jgi:hypothetical protein
VVGIGDLFDLAGLVRHRGRSSPPSPHHGGARGPRSGTEILTGALEAAVGDPSGPGPSVKLIHGFVSQGNAEFGGQPDPFSRNGIPAR